ncbi:MAG: hypothetical protein Q4E75_03705 [bacterium]|nr:hypothetical protein [bacterium]
MKKILKPSNTTITNKIIDKYFDGSMLEYIIIPPNITEQIINNALNIL